MPRPSTFPGRVSDGWTALQSGVNSGVAPNLILPTQYSFGVNTACRGGWLHPRPGLSKISLNFQDNEDAQDNFENALFQEIGGYQQDNGAATLIAMIGGRQYQIIIDNDNEFAVNEITIGSDINPPEFLQAWSCQAENFFIIQDGQSKPYIWDGAKAFRALPSQIPVGRQITYYQGRVWVAISGRNYVAGNQVFDPSGGGNPALNYRNSMLYFTENEFLAGGGAFSVPIQSGDITGFKPIASVNTALGQGELIVTTLTNAFATSVPTDRLLWQNTTYPVQRLIQLSSGVYSQDSIINVNEDLFYRTQRGISTIAYAVRNQGQWGSRPLSTEMNRVLAVDNENFLPFCRGTAFDNRMLMTAGPGISRGHGVYWRGLVPLDFYPISNMTQVAPPAWDGLWTGLRILKPVTVNHFGVERCFVLALNQHDQIELWELSKAQEFDHDGTDRRRITWSIESRSMNFGNAFDLKELTSSDLYFDEVSGQVNFTAQYRPDSYACWVPWETWDACATTSMCSSDFTGACVTLPNFRPQYRPQKQLPQPADTFDEKNSQSLLRTFFELQVRLEVTGFCRMKQMKLNAVNKPDLPEMAQYGQ